MRLICPNCGAQYEVGDEVIPTAGRDVQCSNCGHTWLEKPGASEAAEQALEDSAAQEPQAPPPVWDDADDEDNLPTAPRPPADRPALDASVAEILRQEAALEKTARRGATADPIESQTDLGLEDPAGPSNQEQRNIEAARRMTRLVGEEKKEPIVENAAAAAAAAAAASRKELLPDIEEINSTLRSSADRGEEVDLTPEEIVQTKKRGFRFGFYLMLLIIAALWLIYLFPEPVKSTVPTMADTVDTYVDTVDNARLWLDLKVQGLTASLESTTTE